MTFVFFFPKGKPFPGSKANKKTKQKEQTSNNSKGNSKEGPGLKIGKPNCKTSNKQQQQTAKEKAQTTTAKERAKN